MIGRVLRLSAVIAYATTDFTSVRMCAACLYLIPALAPLTTTRLFLSSQLNHPSRTQLHDVGPNRLHIERDPS
jgi:hypothetical protein